MSTVSLLQRQANLAKVQTHNLPAAAGVEKTSTHDLVNTNFFNAIE